MKAADPASRRPIRAAGLVVVALFLALVARYWSPIYGFTSFLQLDASNDSTKIAAFREQPVYVYHGTGGYDGLYYAQIAYHPALDAPELKPAIDTLTYRARRILLPALAWLLAGGHAEWIVHVYSVLNVVAWLVLAGLLWRLLAVKDARGWIAWAGLMFSTGALSSVRFALTDLTALALVAAALLAAERDRPRSAVSSLAAAALARETSLVALAGLWERPWWSRRNARRTLCAALPFVLWLGYIRWRVGPLDRGMGNFGWPVFPFIQKWSADLGAAATNDLHLLAWTTLLATLGLTVQAAFFLSRWQPTDRWWRLGAAYTLFMLCLGGAVWEGFPGAATRVLLPLNLAFNVLAHRSRAPLAWLLLGNLTVFSGLLTMNFLPNEAVELVAHAGGTTCTARFKDGWFGREHSWRHDWTWSSDHSTLAIESNPRGSCDVKLEFKARCLEARTVTARQDGHEIWHSALGTELRACVIPVHLANGLATLEFSTDITGVPARPSSDVRPLAFAIYDPRLTVSDSK
jgi:hypothetical protein